QVYSVYHEQQTRANAGFDQRLRDTTAEAMATGNVQVPLSESDFVERYGVEKGQQGYAEYQRNVALGADRAALATMAPDEQAALLAKHAPTPGEGFEAQEKRQNILRSDIQHLNAEKAKDPAQYALSRLPTVQSAWAEFAKVVGGQNDMATKRRAAETFAEIMLLEQTRVGVPSEK